jgi:hypothetical protein
VKLRLAVFALCAWLAACAASTALAAVCMEPGGLGGTGARADGGIGGTGSRAQDGVGGTGSKADGGIGGTGARAEGDVGLLGVITGFASICVNGVEVH